jgi:tetratricopeptide (TPR) repeat protein
MLRRLIALLRHSTFRLREAAFALRRWLVDWFYILTAPVRALHPGRALGMLCQGIMEILAMLRLVRPRAFSSELMAGGREAAGLASTTWHGVISAAVAFFWLLVWLPWHLIRAIRYEPIRAWHFLRSRRRRHLLYIAAAALVILGGGGYGVSAFIKERRRNFRVYLLQRQYEDYLHRNNDVEKLESALAALAGELPDDHVIARRLKMVHDREAPASEPNIVRFLMRHHMAAGRVADSVREANELLASFPDDWEARCYLARAAIRRGEPDKAKAMIADLPSVKDSSEMVRQYPIIALESVELFAQLGDQTRFDDMIGFITLEILPELRAKDMVNNSIPYKAFLIQCYYLALSRLDKRPLLTKYWAPLELAFQSIMDDPAADARTLIPLGQAGQKVNLKTLEVFLNQHLISKAEYDTMTRDLMARQRVLWQKVLRDDPKLPGGYVGMAEYFYMVGAPDAAEQALQTGMRECGTGPELLIAMAKLLALIDPNRGVKFLDQNVRDQDMTPAMCSVAEEVAVAAGRWDKALDACRRALGQDSKLDWARIHEAGYWLKIGRPSEAVVALKPIERDLVKYADGCAEYVRALCECGSYKLADEFLDTVTANSCPVEVLLKTAAGLQAAGRHSDAVRWARRALDRDPRNVSALLAVADNSRILADRGARGWDIELVREAVQAYRAAIQLDPPAAVADRAANNLAWLELKALKLPREAFDSAGRLRAIENKVDTKAEYLETLGATYIGVGQFEQATLVLIQAIQTAGMKSSYCMHLALAYHGLHQPARAESYLIRAAEMKMTPMEQAELRQAEQIVRGHQSR